MAAPALFSTSREALTFAVSYSRLPRPPAANGIMVSSLRASRSKKERERDAERELEDRRLAAGRPRPAASLLSTLDRAGQAGLILQLAGRLPDETVHALLAAVLRPRNACSCGAPCCSGFRPNEDWVRSATAVDGLVAAQQAGARPPGRKALATPAVLRRILVEQFFDRSQRETQASIAERLGLSEDTVGKHQKAVGRALVGLVRSGFTELDGILVDAGIVGSVE